MAERKRKAMYVEIYDGVTYQIRKLPCGISKNEAIWYVEELWQYDENGYSYYLLDEDLNEIVAYES